jgi:hypothetical protein
MQSYLDSVHRQRQRPSVTRVVDVFTQTFFHSSSSSLSVSGFFSRTLFCTSAYWQQPTRVFAARHLLTDNHNNETALAIRL